MTAAERAQRIGVGGRTERGHYERAASVPAVWAMQADRTPDAIALADDHAARTYAQSDQRSNQLAHHLIAAGVSAGVTVGVAFDRSIDLPIALLAILKAGGVYVPLDLAYPAERLELMIADAAIRFIVSREALGTQLHFTGRTIRLDLEATTIAARGGARPPDVVDADSPAYIMYTSGSTGRPKGVEILHRGITRLVCGTDYVDIASDDGYLQHAPLAFDASTFEIWAPLLNGARLGIPRPGLLTTIELALAIERFNVTTLFLTTALFGRLVEGEPAGFSRLRQLLTGGEVASPAHMRRFLELYPACRLIAVYGPTENTTFSTWHALPTVEAIGTNVPIGRPIAHSTAYVVDAHGEPAAVGVPGELWVGGDGVARGYRNLPDLSGERFIPDPFAADAGARMYKTGDRARWRLDGVLEFLGRNDDQVKIRGFRIELGEIETVLRAHPGVRDAAVVTAMQGTEKALFAFAAPARESTVSDCDLRDYLSAKLPRYMLPNRISIVHSLPENSSGKVDRVALARMAAQALPPAPSTSPEAVVTNAPRPPGWPGSAQRELQNAIADIWRETLSLAERPGIDVNFFDAGGDSLRLLAVHARLAAQLRTDIGIMDLFEQTTIRKLAAHLRASMPR